MDYGSDQTSREFTRINEKTPIDWTRLQSFLTSLLYAKNTEKIHPYLEYTPERKMSCMEWSEFWAVNTQIKKNSSSPEWPQWAVSTQIMQMRIK